MTFSPAVIVIRHGETEWSKSGQHTGRTDLALTTPGRKQAVQAGAVVRRLLAGQTPAAVLSSPSQRARTTAELAGYAPTEIDPDAREWDYGDYEGLTSAQIHEADPGWRIWDGYVPGGETAADLTQRIDRLLDRARQFGDAGPVLIFSHGHASRCIAARWVQEPVSAGRLFRLGTGAVSCLDYEHAAPVILQWNIDESVTGTCEPDVRDEGQRR